MATLDKSKPYGEVFGQDSARYEQDGKKFNAQGMELKGDTSLAAEDVAESRGLEAALAQVAAEHDITPTEIMSQFAAIEARAAELETLLEERERQVTELTDELTEAKARLEEFETEAARKALEEEAEGEAPGDEQAGERKLSLSLKDLDLSGTITKSEIIAALHEAKIEANPNDTRPVLLELLKKHVEAAKAESGE